LLAQSISEEKKAKEASKKEQLKKKQEEESKVLIQEIKPTAPGMFSPIPAA
jgi:hypothetical protein